MDIYKHRRKRLLELIDTQYGGERVRFCEKISKMSEKPMSESRLAQILSPTYRDGTAFTEKTARKLEKLAGLPGMYFDQGAAPANDATQTQLNSQRQARLVLAYDDEIELLDLYRRIVDKRGQRAVIRFAKGEAGDAGSGTVTEASNES